MICWFKRPNRGADPVTGRDKRVYDIMLSIESMNDDEFLRYLPQLKYLSFYNSITLIQQLNLEMSRRCLSRLRTTP